MTGRLVLVAAGLWGGQVIAGWCWAHLVVALLGGPDALDRGRP